MKSDSVLTELWKYKNNVCITEETDSGQIVRQRESENSHELG